MNREALFSDGTENYVIFNESGINDAVTVRFRAAKGDVRAVYLLEERPAAGGARVIPRVMRRARAEGIFDYYEIKIKLNGEADTQAAKESLRYIFEVEGKEEVCYFDRGGANVHADMSRAFKIIPGFSTPKWAKGAVMYQIFVDRFYNGDPENDVEDGEYFYLDAPSRKVSDWNRRVCPNGVGEFYGGDLAGVIEKLDYLSDLGVEAIYLNPIFVSPSNHKYDVQDYEAVDPHFGVIKNDGGEDKEIFSQRDGFGRERDAKEKEGRATESHLTSGEGAIASNERGFCAKDNSHAIKYRIRTTDPENLKESNLLFSRLVSEAHKRGIKVILDGVFNHCGSFSKWLDKERIYEAAGVLTKGAAIDPESPYRSYFKFQNTGEKNTDEKGTDEKDAGEKNADEKDGSEKSADEENACAKAGSEKSGGVKGGSGIGTYEGWWQHDTLPKLNYEASGELENYILGIARKWLLPPYDADGWRLDVAADLGHSADYNHSFWKKFRKAVKDTKPDAFILAEHYGDPSDWLSGDEWDSVMNYDAFMDPVSLYLTGMEKHSGAYDPGLIGNAEVFIRVITENMIRMPQESLMCAMNEISNHDHSRFLTRTTHKVGRSAELGYDAASEGANEAVMRQAVIMQMTWPGAPTVYYGDEAGLAGFTDPDNRRPYPWGRENARLIAFHKDAIRMRKLSPALTKGSLLILGADGSALMYGRMTRGEKIAVAVNPSADEKTVSIPVWRIEVPDGAVMTPIMYTCEEGYEASFGGRDGSSAGVPTSGERLTGDDGQPGSIGTGEDESGGFAEGVPTADERASGDDVHPGSIGSDEDETGGFTADVPTSGERLTGDDGQSGSVGSGENGTCDFAASGSLTECPVRDGRVTLRMGAYSAAVLKFTSG